jgi:hypothetical protein
MKLRRLPASLDFRLFMHRGTRSSIMLGLVQRAFLIGFLLPLFFAPQNASAQQIETIGSDHILLRMPAERSSIGRDLVSELERCYVFLYRATGQSLPRKVSIFVTWDQEDSSCDRQNAAIIVGMEQPSAETDPRGFLLHSAEKEIARLGLLELSGGARREDTEFLFEGMAEILVHEYSRSSKRLESAWVISKYLDEMKLLGIATQRSWSQFSSGKRCLRTAAPGITLLTTYRELQGREAPMKLFEALRKSSLTASLTSAFKAPVTEIEDVWLKRVREYQIPDEITITGDEAPHLLQTALVPGTGKPGSTVEVQLFLRDRNNNLLPEGVFFRDERTGLLLQAQTPADRGAGYLLVKLPIEPNCPPGEYQYQVTAIDEAGNLRNWKGTYKVGH